MSLRRQNLSPTANLLRNSRLFALPTPLPRPLVSETFGSGSIKSSDTATLPYPTHQAIATTRRSQARGDWGLKRPLPARSRILQTSNPVVRIMQYDSIEQITDFDSATDHVRTRQKFEELNMPLLTGMNNLSDQTAPTPRSAFEKGADVTSYDVEEGLDSAGLALKALRDSFGKGKNAPYTVRQDPATRFTNLRWKHDGPFLPSLSADEFTNYITNQLSGRRAEFKKYLVTYVKAELYNSRARAGKSEPLPLDPLEAEKVRAAQGKQWSTFTSQDIKAGITRLRHECSANPIESELVQKLIIPFLRLPPIKIKTTRYASDNRDEVSQQKFSGETAPSSTHPSAGLGYLLTKAYLTNHPILGPQATPAPVEARVVQPRKMGRSSAPTAKLGVAGFIADDVQRNAGFNNYGKSSRDVGFETLDVDTPGGMKVAVQPVYGAVDTKGHVHIKLVRSYGPELQVSRGELLDTAPRREGSFRDASEELRDLSGNGGFAGRKVPDNPSFLEQLRRREEGKRRV